jgi:hypothetical protein
VSGNVQGIRLCPRTVQMLPDVPEAARGSCYALINAGFSAQVRA